MRISPSPDWSRSSSDKMKRSPTWRSDKNRSWAISITRLTKLVDPNPPDTLEHLLALLLLTRLLSGPHKQMSRLGLASFDLHEFVKLQHPSTTAGIALPTVMEDGRTRMEDTLLVLSIGISRICGMATSTSTLHGWLKRNRRIIGFGLEWRWWGGWSLRGRCPRFF